MTCLYHSHGTEDNVTQDSEGSWISSWLRRYAQTSLTKFEQLAVHTGEQKKVEFSSNAKDKDKLEMMFDEEQDVSPVDRLSQVISINQSVNQSSVSQSVNRSVLPSTILIAFFL